MSPSLSFLDSFYAEKQVTTGRYLVNSGPDEPELSQYVDADILTAHCKVCKLRRREQQQAGIYKAQTFGRRT
jgi:hypothetical protein